ncbi:MAG: ATP-binding protein [Acidobacteriota bacterium]
MRVASKVATGSGLVVLLLGAALVYQVSFARQVAGATDRVSSDYFRVAIVSVEGSRLLEQIEEFLRKLPVVKDPRYAEKIKATAESFESDLAGLGDLVLPSTEVKEEVERFRRLWAEFPLAGELGQPEGLLSLEPEAQAEAVKPLLEELDEIKNKAIAVRDATQYAINEESRAFLLESVRAERLSWTVLGIAFALSILVLLLTVRSINEPLKRLTEGTRAVRGGKLSVRLTPGEDDEFSVLAADFNRMVETLSELDQLKKEFLSRVSHELKTPLVAMQETNQLLLDGLPGPLSERQRRLVELNLQSGRRLSGMIVKLLDLSTLETGAVQYDLKPRDLTDLLRLAIDQFDAQAREREIELRLQVAEPTLVARCDGDRLYQVFENLLENALKFSARGSRVEVHADLVAEAPTGLPAGWTRSHGWPSDDTMILVRVIDQGPGVGDHQKEKIFEKFHQANRRSGSGTGVGLGLAICREVVEAHRGAIWVADGTDGGSVFHVLLHPVREEASVTTLRPAAGGRFA